MKTSTEIQQHSALKSPLQTSRNSVNLDKKKKKTHTIRLSTHNTISDRKRALKINSAPRQHQIIINLWPNWLISEDSVFRFVISLISWRAVSASEVNEMKWLQKLTKWFFFFKREENWQENKKKEVDEKKSPSPHEIK